MPQGIDAPAEDPRRRSTSSVVLWVVIWGFVACVVGLIAVAGAGAFFVARHITTQATTEVAARRTFDAARAPFASTPALIELDASERPHEVRRIDDLPTSPVRPTTLCVLAWNPDDGRLAQASVPFWLLRLGRRKTNLINRRDGFTLEHLNIDVPDLERIGPAIVLDYQTPSGERVLVWTQ